MKTMSNIKITCKRRTTLNNLRNENDLERNKWRRPKNKDNLNNGDNSENEDDLKNMILEIKTTTKI